MMKNPDRLGKGLIAVGLLILLGLSIAHFYVAAHHPLGSYDDYGGWAAVPLVGTLCFVGGIFVLALSGNGKDR